MALSETTREQARQLMARYPKPRSALLPMLHLVQAEEGYVTSEGVGMCAELLGLTKAEVGAVATFYTMYKRRPVGDYHVGVCTNTLWAVMGGDEIYVALKDHLGVEGQDAVTDDVKVSLEHIECNAACDYAPVVMVNWEFFDNQTPGSARELTDRLRAGEPVEPTRGAASVCSFKQLSRVLAGFGDGRSAEGAGAGPATVRGTLLAKERGWTAPSGKERDRKDRGRRGATADQLGPVTASSESTARGGVTSSHDGQVAAPDSSRGGTTAGKPPGDATEGPADSGRATTPRPATRRRGAPKDTNPGDGAEG